MKIDYKTLNADLIRRCPGMLTEWFPQGVARGHEFKVGSTSGEKGKSLSVNIKSGVWEDFATGQHGDLIELYAQSQGCTNGQAAEQLIQKYTIRDAVEDEVVLPVPKNFHREAKTSDASIVHEYLNAKGELLFYMLRHDQGSGKKSFTPLSYWRNTGWQKKMPPGKRPLYGLRSLAQHPQSTVIVVEGEKSADAGVGDYVYVTWPNGSSSYSRAYWSALAGRSVILWPDADDPGIKAMNGLAELLKKSKVRSIRTLDVSGQSSGWDVADAVAEGWGAEQVSEFIETATTVYPLADAPEEIGPNVHFRTLGYHGRSFVFYIQGTGQVLAYRGTELDQWGNLLTLAPAHYWDEGYESKKPFIMNALIRKSEAAGYYDPSVVRGRGVWEDDGRSVLHLGNKLIVDGAECDMRTFKTDYIYEQRVPIHIRSREPLDASEATKLVDVCNLVTWEEKISGFLLAGWIFSSVICGVLPWRSHIYLTGPVGSGKSWVIENLIKRCLRGIGMAAQGKTTEPGLRQAIQGDARPVLLDESEGDSKKNAERLQAIFDLARQASSEGAAPIIKGTQNQSAAIQYVIRSCFAFASIQPSMTHYADESRITLLRLSTSYGGGGPRFQKLLKARNEILTEEFCDGLISRAVRMAPIIRRSHQIFAEAGEEKFENRRASDQFAMMLAGLYCLMNDRPPQDHEDAKEFILRWDWDNRIEEGPRPSEVTLLETILQSEVVLDSGASRKMLGELIAEEISNNGRGDYAYKGVLRRHGLKVVGGTLHIANHCVNLKRILRDTPWADRWGQTLINTKGAEKSAHGEFFAAGMNSRSVIIPMPDSLQDGGVADAGTATDRSE